MAIIWSIKTELINQDTQLRKVIATRTDDGDIENITVRNFSVKARMKTIAEKTAVWENIRQQYLDSIEVITDAVATEGKVYLSGKELL